MTIQTRDQLIDALGNNSDRIVIDKASIPNAVAGQIFSLWRATGMPGQGSTPSTAALCTKSLTGAFSFTNPLSGEDAYLAWLTLVTSNDITNVEIHDRLAHMGGLSGTVTTSQGALNLASLSVPAARIGDTNYSDVQWWLEWYTDTGGTSVTATVAVTYDDNSTGNLAAITLGTTARASRMFPLISASAGKFIKNVTGVTLSATTGTAGNFGITATRLRTSVSTSVANKAETFDWAQLGLPSIEDDACLMMVMMCSNTTTGAVRGGAKIAKG